ncbi:MAG TPA: archaemetzincin family Zn-dependent metalloprotease [Anaeromyxobacteraceae bacterium]|nr:archaemetzincin family Zn-dependent metalloprotease [Anaeromyxobacteraceae bacterium]
MERILVWWIGERHPGTRALEHVRMHLQRAFGAPAALWEGPERPSEAYDPGRKQWSSTRILAWLARSGPPGRVLGVTDVDLFIPILTFVFGEAQVGGRAAVVSTARLGEPGLRDDRVVLERLSKESVHEMGHVLGLLHCGTPGCVMGRSASVRDVDGKRGEPCAECRESLVRGRREAT